MLARGVYPLGCAVGMAARAVNDRPYTAMYFVYDFSGRFVGDAYMRPVQFTRYIALSGRLRRAAYMPPLQANRKFAIILLGLSTV